MKKLFPYILIIFVSIAMFCISMIIGPYVPEGESLWTATLIVTASIYMMIRVLFIFVQILKGISTFEKIILLFFTISVFGIFGLRLFGVIQHPTIDVLIGILLILYLISISMKIFYIQKNKKALT